MKLNTLAYQELSAWLASAVAAAADATVTRRVVDFVLPAYWDTTAGAVHLIAVYDIDLTTKPAHICALVSDKVAQLKEIMAVVADSSMLDLSLALQTPVLDCNSPLALRSVDIPKPWGKEVWYTGIEKRGLSQVGAAGQFCPLPWAIAALPDLLLTPDAAAPILLKILDPLPEPVFGDLYFELHEVKQEVYVVTHIDESCWPNAEGAIRIGFNQQKRRSFADDSKFKKAYSTAVNRYREIRQQIDARLDQQRRLLGIAEDTVITVQQTRQWLAALPDHVRKLEHDLRRSMDDFTGWHSVKVGDVIVIPKRLPHALQHGVRAVEFQTPVYERQIVSFAQKVLTQAHWDTAAALQVTQLEPYSAPQFASESVNGCQSTRIVDFDDFTVTRVSMPLSGQLQLRGSTYKLLMVVSGHVKVGSVDCRMEQALLLPCTALPLTLQNVQADASIVLVAEPRQVE